MRRSGRWLVVCAVLLVAPLCVLLVPPEVEAAPIQCKVGTYLTSLRSFDPSAGTFTAEMWLWSVCPDRGYRPLKSLTFLNADSTSVALYTNFRVNNVYWAKERVTGTFRYNWDLGNFPFDRHTLSIRFGDSLFDIRHLVLVPDVAGSTVSKDLSLEGWGIRGLQVTSAPHRDDSVLGFPGVSPNTRVATSRVSVNISIVRTNYDRLLLLVAGVYIAVTLAFFGLFMPVQDSATRLSLAASALFVVVVSLTNANNFLGSVLGVSLVGEIHLVGMLYILIIAAITVVYRRMSPAPYADIGAESDYVDTRLMVALAATFVAINALLFGIALMAA